MYISPDQDEYARSATVWERVTAQIGVESELQSRAALELKRRLNGWHGDYLPRPTRFKNRSAIDRGDHLIVPADPVELIIVRAVAMTRGAAQFGVSPNGAIFTARGEGWTIHGPRIDLTRLSWLLDEAADILQQIRRGRGGRFYERNGRFFLADDRTTILQVIDQPEPVAPPLLRPDAHGTWWQQAISAVTSSWTREFATPTEAANDVELSSEVIWATQAPVRRRTAPRSHSEPRVCPLHHIELPLSGRCDQCAAE